MSYLNANPALTLTLTLSLTRMRTPEPDHDPNPDLRSKVVDHLTEVKPTYETRAKAVTTPASLLLIARSVMQRPIQNHDGANDEAKRLIFAPVLGVKSDKSNSNSL